MAERSERQPVLAVEIILLEQWKVGEFGVDKGVTPSVETVFKVIQLDKKNGQLVVQQVQGNAQEAKYPSRVNKLEKSQVKKLKLS